MIRPLLFQLDAERAHGLAIAALKWLPFSRAPHPHALLSTRVAGLVFPSPVGMAAGFDKEAEVMDSLLGLGFGFVEAGTITPLPQPGNPRPRVFRLVEDEGVINAMGFNSGGQDAAVERLRKRGKRPGIVGINVGANKESADRIADYAHGVRLMAPYADYLTMNISSPNTQGLRALQARAALEELLSAAIEARGPDGPPLFLKVAPDLDPPEIEDVCAAVLAHGIDGIIIGNTTTIRQQWLKSPEAKEPGGLSGKPLTALANDVLGQFYRQTAGKLPLIGAGGIASAEDAYTRIRTGASLIQIYSAMVYAGPRLAQHINDGLVRLLQRDGLKSISEAVGVDNR